MSRIRSIHPGLWTDEAFASLPDGAALLYIGLLNEADDNGVFEWKPLTIKMRLRPASAMTAGDVEASLMTIQAAGMVAAYEVGGKKYGAIRNFVRWQRPKLPKSVHPMTPHLLPYLGFNPEGKRPRAGTGRPPSDDDDEPLPKSGETASEVTRQRKEEGGRRKKDLLPAKPPATSKLDGQRPPHRSANDEAWERFKAAYPKRKGDFEWKTARERFDRAIRDGTDPDAIIAGAARYAEQQRSLGHIGTPYVKQASSFMAARTWEEFHDQPKANGQHGPSPPKDDHDAEMRLHVGRDNRKWPTPKWGAMPNRPGCLIPPHLIKPDDGEGWTEWEQ
jgi:hypothetical protein